MNSKAKLGIALAEEDELRDHIERLIRERDEWKAKWERHCGGEPTGGFGICRSCQRDVLADGQCLVCDLKYRTNQFVRERDEARAEAEAYSASIQAVTGVLSPLVSQEGYSEMPNGLAEAAAVEIVRGRVRIAELEGALRPFAEAARAIEGEGE